MLTAATNPDVAATTVGYALCAVTVGMLLAGLLIYAAWTTRGGRVGRVEAWLDRRLARRRERALQENTPPAIAYHRGRRPTAPEQRPAARQTATSRKGRTA